MSKSDLCPLHGEKTWCQCWSCGGEGYHDLYDDDPLWYDPGDEERCDICKGAGGYYVCGTCHPESVDDL